MKERVSFGYAAKRDLDDLQGFLALVQLNGFNFLVVNVCDSANQDGELDGLQSSKELKNQNTYKQLKNSEDECEQYRLKRFANFTKAGFNLTTSIWSTSIVAVVNANKNIDSDVTGIRHLSETLFRQQLDLVSHLSLSAILFDLPVESENLNLGRILNSYLVKSNSFPQVWIGMKMNDRSWKTWTVLSNLLNTDKRVGICLRLEDLSVDDDDLQSEIINRWMGEPIKAMSVNSKQFHMNAKGFPVLDKEMRSLIAMFFRLDVYILIEEEGGGGSSERGVTVADMNNYQAFLAHLHNAYVKNETERDCGAIAKFNKFTSGYEDYIQAPLQPLMDNLESGTYEVFEKDPVKYEQYEKAIFKALVDLTELCEETNLVVMVLGAGRGPLIQAVLNAWTKISDVEEVCCQPIKIFGVEKNGNAILTLNEKRRTVWKAHDVTIIKTDMRKWTPPKGCKAHLVISELLGSFGDNELSPECLYDAQHLMIDPSKTSKGVSYPISIPCEYTSYLAPIQSSKLYNETRGATSDWDGSALCKLGQMETPYVVHIHNHFKIDQPKPVFQFTHPERQRNFSNELVQLTNRHKILTFNVQTESVMHGLAGYFECILYDDITISILPSTHSAGMFSWFPLYFPLYHPIPLRVGDVIKVPFWRVNNNTNVWYEWSVSSPVTLPIHNSNGRSYTIGGL